VLVAFVAHHQPDIGFVIRGPEPAGLAGYPAVGLNVIVPHVCHGWGLLLRWWVDVKESVGLQPEFRALFALLGKLHQPFNQLLILARFTQSSGARTPGRIKNRHSSSPPGSKNRR
jgi:hypothetical protein